jgi:hypothetical protein
MKTIKADPLFMSARSALVFAYNFSGQSLARPPVNRMAAPSAGTGKGLGGLDGAAQAGFIRREVKVLGTLPEAILIARIAPRSTPCGCRALCCSGQKPNREWIDSINLLADHMRQTALAGCTSNGLMCREYVLRHFTVSTSRTSFEKIAEGYEVNRQTVGSHAGKVAKLLRALEHAADGAISDRLRMIGMAE